MRTINQFDVNTAITNVMNARLQSFRSEIYKYTEDELINCGDDNYVVINFQIAKDRGLYALMLDIKSFDEEYVVRPKHGLSRMTKKKRTEITTEESGLRLLMQELCKNEVVQDQFKAFTHYYELDYELLMTAINEAEPNNELVEHYEELAKERAKHIKVTFDTVSVVDARRLMVPDTVLESTIDFKTAKVFSIEVGVYQNGSFTNQASSIQSFSDDTVIINDQAYPRSQFEFRSTSKK